MTVQVAEHPASQGEEPAPSWLGNALSGRLAAAGVELNGPNPWDPQIRRPRAIVRMLVHGTLGAGEAYMDGDWDCAALEVLTDKLLSAGSPAVGWLPTLDEVRAFLFNRQSLARAAGHVTAHYDIGNDLYAAMLGPTKTYSCAYWKDADGLDAAQDAKHTLVCRMLGLQRGHRVLDLGCGWGGFLQCAAERFGATVTGITLSPAQAAVARERCAGLPVEVRLQDYREVQGEFDRVVSIGMFEHVGPRNYGRFFSTMARVLTRDGLVLLRTIGGRQAVRATDPWIDRYIFPGSVLPSAAQIAAAAERQFVLEDWQNTGADYDRTLMAWYANVEAAWPALGEKYDERFRRMWRYYLLTSAGSFRARYNQLWQIVLSPRGVRGGYRPTRLPAVVTTI